MIVSPSQDLTSAMSVVCFLWHLGDVAMFSALNHVVVGRLLRLHSIPAAPSPGG